VCTAETRVRGAPAGELVKSRHQRGGRRPSLVDPEFADAFAGAADHASSRRHAEHKAQQLCRQVQRALNLALADWPGADVVGDMFIDEVTPAPDCGHLLVHVVVPPECPITEALSALRQDTPRLRSHVAMAITRKRAPELSFVPTVPQRGDDD
jgi:ribosome-binding factor A